MKFCNKCGTEIQKDKNFCHKCGNEIAKRLKEHKSSHVCSNCQFNNSELATFCGECGHKLVIHHINKRRTSRFRKIFLLHPLNISIILLVLSAVILLPTKAISYQTEVPYVTTEKYSVQVPYEDVEEYNVQVPYETEEQYIESIPVKELEPYQEIECGFLGLFCETVTKYKEVTTYKDVIKTKPVTEYRDETKYRKVTKMRTEVREKEVLKTRLETKYKEVNWIFKFDALIKFRDLSKYD